MVTHSRRASKHYGRGRVLPNHLQARTRELGRTSSWTATWTATRAAGSGSPAGSCRVHADPFGACPAGTGERGDESARRFETGRRAHGGGEPRFARTGCWSQRPGRASGLTQRFSWFFEAAAATRNHRPAGHIEGTSRDGARGLCSTTRGLDGCWSRRPGQASGPHETVSPWFFDAARRTIGAEPSRGGARGPTSVHPQPTSVHRANLLRPSEPRAAPLRRLLRHAHSS